MNHSIFIKQITLHEGKRTKPYLDTVNKITIGVGRNLSDRGLSENEILVLLENDIAECITQLDQKLPWWRNLSEVRQHVLLDMCFNLGITKLLKFGRTLNSMKLGAYEVAAEQMLESKWAEQVGRRAIRLSFMMRNNVFPGEIL